MKKTKIRTIVAAIWLPILSSSSYAIQSQTGTENTQSAIAHPVGSCYGGGVVFYVNTTPGAHVGQQGLIVALQDAPNGAVYEWDTKGETQEVIAPLTTYFSGAKNTANILADMGSDRAQAAYAATQTRDGGYSDWYLPSRDELMALFTQANFSGEGFWTHCGGIPPNNTDDYPNQIYWSSSQLWPNTAWLVSFGGEGLLQPGFVNYYETDRGQYAVRAVRAF